MKQIATLLTIGILALPFAGCCPCKDAMKSIRYQHQAVRYNSRDFVIAEYRNAVNSGCTKQEACDVSFDALKRRLNNTTIEGVRRAERTSWVRHLYKID